MPHTVCLSFELFFLYVKNMYWYSGMDLTDPAVSMVVHGGLTGVNSHDLTNSVFWVFPRLMNPRNIADRSQISINYLYYY